MVRRCSPGGVIDCGGFHAKPERARVIVGGRGSARQSRRPDTPPRVAADLSGTQFWTIARSSALFLSSDGPPDRVCLETIAAAGLRFKRWGFRVAISLWIHGEWSTGSQLPLSELTFEQALLAFAAFRSVSTVS